MATYKLVYNRKNKLDADGKALVQIEVYQNKRRRYFTTGVRVKPAEWNSKNREVKGNPLTNQTIHQRLNELRSFEVAFPSRYSRPMRLDDFDLLFIANEETNNPVVSFSAYMLTEVNADKPGVALSTYQRRLRVVKRLAEHMRREVPLADLSYAFISRFDQALRGRFKLDDNTVEAEHKILKRYISRAVKSGLLAQNPYDGFKIRGKAVDKTILTDEEIRRIERLTLSGDQAGLALCRDAFLLAFYSMLRVSDLISLTTKHLQETSDGLQIEKKQQKTRHLVRIPLGTLHGGKAQDLLRAYWPAVDGKRFFPRTAQYFNRRLKDLLPLAGITKPQVGFHTARHSGITCLVRHGIPLAVVQRVAGHADIKMTMQYVHLAGTDIKNALSHVKNW